MWQKKMAIFLLIAAVLTFLCFTLLIEVLDISGKGTVAGTVAIYILVVDVVIALFLFGRTLELKKNKASVILNVSAIFLAIVLLISTIIGLIAWRL